MVRWATLSILNQIIILNVSLSIPLSSLDLVFTLSVYHLFSISKCIYRGYSWSSSESDFCKDDRGTGGVEVKDECNS